MTHSLYNRYKETEEKVSGFYISADEKSLIVIGEKFHYIFPLESDLKNVLKWVGRSKVKADFSQFTLLADGEVSGNYYLGVDSKDTNAADHEYLRGLGFLSERSELRLSRNMSGKFYSAGQVSSTSSFNKIYTIKLSEDASIPTPIKVALTPITVAADGVLWIGGIALFSLWCFANNMVGKECYLRS